MAKHTYEIAYYPKSDTFGLSKICTGLDKLPFQYHIASASTREELEERIKKTARETVTHYDENGNRIT